jgi:hypothetical protein
MQRVSAQPEFRERVLTGIRDVPKVGEFLSANLIERLPVLILWNCGGCCARARDVSGMVAAAAPSS